MLKRLALLSSILSLNPVFAADDRQSSPSSESLNIQDILSGDVKGTGRFNLDLESLKVFLRDVLHTSVSGQHSSTREKYSRHTALFDNTHVQTSLANSVNFQNIVDHIQSASIDLSDIKFDGLFNLIYTITCIGDSSGVTNKWQLPLTIDKQQKKLSARIVEGAQTPLYVPTPSPVLDQNSDENDSVADLPSPPSSQKINTPRNRSISGSLRKLFKRSDSSSKKENSSPSSSSSSPIIPRSSSATSSPQRKGSTPPSPQLGALNKELSGALAKRNTVNGDGKTSGSN